VGGLMSRLVPKLRFKEFSGEWEDGTLEGISEIVRGGSPRPIDKYMTLDKDALNWLKIADVDKNSKYVTFTKERVKKTALSKTREVHPNDLILSNSMSFGRPYIMKIKSCIHDGWIAVTNILKDINTHYLYYIILSPISQKFFVDYAAGGGIRNLNADIIKSLPVSFSKDPKEQQKIASCLSSLDALIEAQNKKVSVLKQHKKGLMQQLFPAEGERMLLFLICPDLLQDISLLLNIHLILFDIFYLVFY
jgi:type I restriction enzyme S subunit